MQCMPGWHQKTLAAAAGRAVLGLDLGDANLTSTSKLWSPKSWNTFWTLQVASNAIGSFVTNAVWPNLEGCLAVKRRTKCRGTESTSCCATSMPKLQMQQSCKWSPKREMLGKSLSNTHWRVLSSWVVPSWCKNGCVPEAFFRGDDKALTLYGTKSWAPSSLFSQVKPGQCLWWNVVRWTSSFSKQVDRRSLWMLEVLKFHNQIISLLTVNSYLLELNWIIPWLLGECNKKIGFTGKLLSPKGDEDDEASRCVWSREFCSASSLGTSKPENRHIPQMTCWESQDLFRLYASIAQPLFCWLWKGPLDTAASWVFWGVLDSHPQGPCWKNPSSLEGSTWNSLWKSQ